MIDRVIYKILETLKIISLFYKVFFFIKKSLDHLLCRLSKPIIVIYFTILITFGLLASQYYTIYIIKCQKKEIAILKDRIRIIELKLKMPDILYQEMQSVISKYHNRIGAVYFIEEKNSQNPFTKENKIDKIIQFHEFWCHNNFTNNKQYKQCTVKNQCLTEIIDCPPDVLKNALKIQSWKFSQLFIAYGDNLLYNSEIKCFQVKLNTNIEGLVYQAFTQYEFAIACEIESSVGFLFLIPVDEINTAEKKYDFDAKIYLELQSFVSEVLIKKNN